MLKRLRYARRVDLVTEQRLARRAAILEAARQMIAERGYEAVTVRDLAERCRVSVPTLYNQFGGKDALLAEAVEEHFVRVLSAADLAAARPGFERLERVVSQCAAQLLTLSAYHRRLIEAFASLEQTTAVQQRIAGRLTAVFAAELASMRTARQLETWVDTDLIAEHLTSSCISAAVIWSSGTLPDAHLAPAMRYATALVLVGITRGQVASRLKMVLVESQDDMLRLRRPLARRLAERSDVSKA
ncbi:MAG: TetR/AcrR family transcriptional regulator [Pseudomonadales bacterium]